MNKPLASLSLDLDNKWSYLKIHGDESWKEFPSYLNVAVPRILEILEQEKLRITFFVVGQDAALPEHRDALRSIVQAGHEIGNHSFHHESWLHQYSEAAIRREIEAAHRIIEDVTGATPTGFRGPGFSLSETVLKVLADLGYKYDGSTWPTFIGPLARAYYMRTGEFSEEQQKDRDVLFGTFADGLRPNTPYRWATPARGLLEIPVSTFPLLRIPAHLSYMLYLLGYSPALAALYQQMTFRAFRMSRRSPSFLLHTLDFLGGDDVKGLEFFPAMNMNGSKKVAFAQKALRRYRDMFNVVPMAVHASVAKRQSLKVIVPRFDRGGPVEVSAPGEEAICRPNES